LNFVEHLGVASPADDKIEELQQFLDSPLLRTEELIESDDAMECIEWLAVGYFSDDASDSHLRSNITTNLMLLPLSDAGKRKLRDELATHVLEKWCTCRRGDDGTTMAQCECKGPDGCEFGTWFHLSCLGIKRAPLHFVCVQCEEAGCPQPSGAKSHLDKTKSKPKKKRIKRRQLEAVDFDESDNDGMLDMALEAIQPIREAPERSRRQRKTSQRAKDSDKNLW
jgi:hypothetical protein